MAPVSGQGGDARHAATHDEALAADVLERWTAAMRAGNFEAAWQQTDRIEATRRRRSTYPSDEKAPHELLWNGTPFERRRVLIRCEHGLGDTLQFIRFVPLVAKRASALTLLLQPALLPLLAQAHDMGRVLDGWSGAPAPGHDVEIEVMELAYALRMRPGILPRPPYLPLAPLREHALRLPIALGGGRLRVGLVWAASGWDRRRSVPLRMLAPLALPWVDFYSLQQGPEAAEWRRAPFPLNPLSKFTANVASAAAAMLQLDLVITVDGMIAHLAGALGRPVWVVLPCPADWRWMRGAASPWYPSMRLFRQQSSGAWAPAIEGVAAALEALCAEFAVHANRQARRLR